MHPRRQLLPKRPDLLIASGDSDAFAIVVARGGQRSSDTGSDMWEQAVIANSPTARIIAGKGILIISSSWQSRRRYVRGVLRSSRRAARRKAPSFGFYST